MQKPTLSIFVDESGNLYQAKDSSRFYLLCLLLHDQSKQIDTFVHDFERCLDRMGLTNLCFHAGPIIRHEDGYEYMNWELRNRIFSMMMAFARKIEFGYRCVSIDKKYTSSCEQIIQQLQSGVTNFLDSVFPMHDASIGVEVYYDCGQTPITKILHEVIEGRLGTSCSFVPDVKPAKYKLFQVADMICTISLIAKKIAAGLRLTKSEDRFFGGPRKFKRNFLKPILAKEI